MLETEWSRGNFHKLLVEKQIDLGKKKKNAGKTAEQYLCIPKTLSNLPSGSIHTNYEVEIIQMPIKIRVDKQVVKCSCNGML